MSRVFSNSIKSAIADTDTNTSTISTHSTDLTNLSNDKVDKTSSSINNVINVEAVTGSARIELGTSRTNSNYSYIDFIGDTTYSDYGLRIIRGNTGANTSNQILSRGTGDFVVGPQEAGTLKLRTNGADRIVVNGSTGVVTMSAYTTPGPLIVNGSGVISAAGYGLETAWVPAAAMSLDAENPPEYTVYSPGSSWFNPEFQAIAFDSSADERVHFNITMPPSWNRGSITAKFYWTATSGSGGVAWAFTGATLSDNDALASVNYSGANITTTDTLLATNDLMVSPESGNLNVLNTYANDDIVTFQIHRQTANAGDTLAADALLFGARLIYTVDTLWD